MSMCASTQRLYHLKDKKHVQGRVHLI